MPVRTKEQIILTNIVPLLSLHISSSPHCILCGSFDIANSSTPKRRVFVCTSCSPPSLLSKLLLDIYLHSRSVETSDTAPSRLTRDALFLASLSILTSNSASLNFLTNDPALLLPLDLSHEPSISEIFIVLIAGLSELTSLSSPSPSPSPTFEKFASVFSLVFRNLIYVNTSTDEDLGTEICLILPPLPSTSPPCPIPISCVPTASVQLCVDYNSNNNSNTHTHTHTHTNNTFTLSTLSSILPNDLFENVSISYPLATFRKSCKCELCTPPNTQLPPQQPLQDLPDWRLKSIGDYYMQSNNFSAALNIYGLLVAKPQASMTLISKGDAINCLAASTLESGGRVDEAYKIWVEGAKSEPGCKVLVETARKISSYRLNDNINVIINDKDLPKTTSYLAKKVFLTSGGVINAKNCNRIIEICEEYESGWTTSRHYSVPTTDLPIHELGEEVLEWFNELCVSCLAGLVKREYGIETLRIHDAFIVKYDFEGGQREIPVHVDQSDVSFTIALNDAGQFEGGGTWFQDLGDDDDEEGGSIKPQGGGICGFKGGELMHSGAQITSGVRYVCVVFAYKGGGCEISSPSASHISKKYKQTISESSASFSFDFKE